MNNRKIKTLHCDFNILADLLKLDGTTALKVCGMPSDATLLAIATDARTAKLTLHSEEWDEVAEGAPIPELELSINAFGSALDSRWLRG